MDKPVTHEGTIYTPLRREGPRIEFTTMSVDNRNVTGWAWRSVRWYKSRLANQEQ